MIKSKGTENWSEIKVKIKERFSKLTDTNIESLKGSLDLLSAKLQTVYGYAKEKADAELKSFQESIHSMTEGGAHEKRNTSTSMHKSSHTTDSKSV